MRDKDQILHFRVNKAELSQIKDKMAQLGVRNMGAYLRKMALDGYCVRLDLDDVREIVRLLRIMSNNLNQ